MTRTFADLADMSDVGPDEACFEQCEGYASFLAAMLDGEQADRHPAYVDVPEDSGATPCSMTINFRNADSRFERLGRVHGDCEDAGEPSCTGGFNQDPNAPCGGFDYDDILPVWVTRGSTSTGTRDVYCYSGVSGRCATPDTGCSRYTNLGGDWRVLMPPVELFYHGFTCDRILFLARMCADRAVDLMGEGSLDEALAMWQTASRIARYALVIIAHMGASLVHEVGHVYLGYGHCSNGKNCCFSAAALVWLCRVRARLGLPREKLEPDPAGDYNGEHRLEFGYRRCGSSDDYAFLCDVSAEGVVGQSATVLATTCRSSEEFTNGCS